MSALEVLSVSVNSISTLKDIGECLNLKELYIRRNCVESLDEIDYLTPLRNLKIIWLAENPVATLPGYRNYVLNKLPNLEKLDNVEITFEDRQAASSAWTGANELRSAEKKPELNSFAAAAVARKRPYPNKDNSESPQQEDEQRSAQKQRDNPNSTNPYFQNKVRSPDLAQKQNR